jgi:hypothetical protein
MAGVVGLHSSNRIFSVDFQKNRHNLEIDFVLRCSHWRPDRSTETDFWGFTESEINPFQSNSKMVTVYGISLSFCVFGAGDMSIALNIYGIDYPRHGSHTFLGAASACSWYFQSSHYGILCSFCRVSYFNGSYRNERYDI